MPNPFRLRRKLKPPAPVQEPTPAPAVDPPAKEGGQQGINRLGFASRALRLPGETVQDVFRETNEAIGQFSDVLRGVDLAPLVENIRRGLDPFTTTPETQDELHRRTAMVTLMRRHEEERRGELMRETQFALPEMMGVWRTVPHVYEALCDVYLGNLGAAYTTAMFGTRGEFRCDYSTVVILQTDMVYLFLDRGAQLVALCRINDGYATQYNLRGRMRDNRTIGAMMGMAVEIYLSSRHFLPA